MKEAPEGNASQRSPSDTGLVSILADMLRSALEWEVSQGMPPGEEGLTGSPLRIHCPPPCGQEVSQHANQGDENNGYSDGISEQERT